jgi:chromosome segregation protein
MIQGYERYNLMQLKKIKLAGFKSFVDPTTVLVPTNLVAIVGPNGCGKSNIIDAVCWVMGENSAKYLRGESLADVIFNGSTARKPVGQASVELVFDNQDGSLGGEYASYAEISIRRQISRDSESAYFLNGVRCRRRDIVDIFLGTGLGPRSYSIIGQNMISRIIEAKPDEMRVYLEEAAGVSRYKERRRETENRIHHTKENLARLNDVRTELDKQLSALKRQANAAEKYKILKQEERIVRAEWLTIQWRELDTRLVNDTLQIQQQATGLEARQAELTELNLQWEYKREGLRETNEVFQEVQQRYYAIGNEITRLEQDVAHTEERQKERQQALQNVEQETESVSQQFEEANEQLEELSQDAERLEPEAKEAIETAEQLKIELSDAEDAMQNWQTQWDSFNQLASKTTQIAEVEQTRIQHLEQKIIASQQRQAKLEEEKALIDFSKLENSITELNDEVQKAADETENQQKNLAEVQQQISTLRSKEQKTAESLNRVQGELQVLQGKEASLQALQETALGRRNDTLTSWLKTHALDKKPRLAEEVQVESGWDQAVEKVLGAYLQAICVDDMQNVLELSDKLKQGSLLVVAPTKISVKPESNTLLSKVNSEWPLASLLAGIYIASSKEEALAMAKKLSPHESVITQDGVWIGNGWLRISRDENPEAGVFQREEELRSLTKKIKELRVQHEEETENLSEYREQLKDYENQQESLQKSVNQANIKAAQIQTEQKITRERLKELKDQLARFEKEHTESISQLKTAEEELKASRDKWQKAMDALSEQATKKDELSKNRDILRNQLQLTRTNANLAKDTAHQLEIRLQTTLSELSSLKQMTARLQTQLGVLNERHETLQAELEAASSLETIQNNLEIALKKRLTLEEELNEARTKDESINQELRQIETHKQEVEREMSKLRDRLERLRIESQGLKVKSETLLEQIKEIGFNIEDVLKQLPEITGLEEWHERLQQITLRISRLGAINLVAIEEYTSCAERKEYLDKQNADLEEGLATLENAIAKIDKETRTRFKDTFDKVNGHFQELFPKVFAGGKSYLELTGDNLLDAGVTVMACPPGKRNSTIHLLSGGEKALTAIALVFSIFQLNAAPFCILDEVDAPLDDANVGRFCQLVKDMSEKTQFIFISHNKLAIEMANTLIGVTMNEPGVSRLVSVDVQEAMTLAGV